MGIRGIAGWGRFGGALLALASGLVFAEGGIRHHGTPVPAGFESLLEEQTTLVDLYYGGRFRGAVLARFTPQQLTFLRPAEVVALIPDVEDQNALTAFLGEPLPTHSEQVCAREGQPLCGRITPDYAGIIFDESRFRVRLFVHPQVLAKASLDGQRYLPAADQDRLTAVNNLSALTTGGDNQSQRYSLFGRSRASYNHGFAFADWVATDRQNLSMDQLGYRQDFIDHQFTVGLFDSNTDQLRALPRDPLVGISTGSSLLRRADRSALLASPLEVFLPVRGRVDIFRDGRLISSGFYEAGNQLIDSERLPAGAYAVDIVITAEDGTVSERQQLFVKSALIAPPGQPLWFVEGGQVRRRGSEDLFPESQDAHLLKGGYRWRERPWLGLGVAGALSEDDGLLELSANLFNNWIEAGGEVFRSSAGGDGVSGRAVARYNNSSASVSLLQINADDAVADPQAFQLLPREQRLASLQLTQRLGLRDLLSLSISEQRSQGLVSRRQSLRYSHNRVFWGGQSLNLGAEVGRVDGDSRLMLSLQWRQQRQHWQHNLGLQWTESDAELEDDGLAATAATRWRDHDRFDDELELGLAAQVSEQRQSLTMDGEHRSQYGRGRAALSFSESSGERNQQYLAGYDSSVLVGDAGLAVGGQRQGEAGLIVDLRDAPEGRYAVLVNGREETVARGGRRAALALPGYREHSVLLRDHGTTLVNVDGLSQTQSLYPGNVATMAWQTTAVNVVLGRLYRLEQHCSVITDSCYTLRLPLGGARIDGALGPVITDREGFFQAEVDSRKAALYSEHQGQPCELPLAPWANQQGVIRADALVCGDDEDAGEQPSGDE